MIKVARWCRWGKWTALTYLLSCLALYLYQDRLIYQPETAIKTTPADRDIPYQDVWIAIDKTGKSKEKLFGWWLPARGKQIGTILYLHGYNQNIGTNLDSADALNQLGYNVLLVDYRGYGKSQGKFPSERQLYADAEIAWNYLVQARNLPPKQIVIFGYSLGGAIAIDLAIHHPEASSLIVQSSFTSMSAVIDNSPWSKLVPVRLLLNQKFASIAKVRSLQMPVLYLHGANDRYIPVKMSRSLYQATSTANKKLVVVPDAGHWNYSKGFRTPENLETISQFIERSLAKPLGTRIAIK